MTEPTEALKEKARALVDDLPFKLDPHTYATRVLASVRAEADAAATERAAASLERRARALVCGRRRTNRMDRHTADVLMANARAIREAAKP